MQRKDYISEITAYIKKNLKKGYTKDSLKWALVQQGYPKIEVEKAFVKVDEELAREAPILETKPEIKVEVIEPANAVIEEKKGFFSRLFGL